MSDDRYASFDYSRLINWEERLRREAPLFDELLQHAPSKRVLDLGAGTGEHARFLAARGFEVTGIDSSPAMLEKSRVDDGGAEVRFLADDIRELTTVQGESFGAAICVGNVLPHLTGEKDLARLAATLRRLLVPGAPFLLQMINYDRIEAKKERALPLNFLRDADDPDATIIFLRTMELLPDGRVIFMPTTLRQRADRETPLEVVSTRRVEIRGLRRSAIEQEFTRAGFSDVAFHGSFAREAFDPAESRDLIMVAR